MKTNQSMEYVVPTTLVLSVESSSVCQMSGIANGLDKFPGFELTF